MTVTPVAAGTEPYDLTLNKITLPVDSAGNRFGTATEVSSPDIDTYNSAYFSRRNGVFVFQCPDGGATTSADASSPRSELRHLTNLNPTDPSQDELDFAVVYIPNGHKVVCHQIHGFGVDDSPWVKMVYTGKDNGTGIYRALIQPAPTSNDPTHPLVTVTLKQNLVNGDRTKCKIKVVQESGRTFLESYIDGGTSPSTVLAQSSGADNLVGQPCRVEMFRTTEYYYKRGAYYQNHAGLGDYVVVEHYTNSGQYTP